MGRLNVRVTPRAGRDEIGRVELGDDGAAVVRARVAAAPADGRANDALEKLLASALGVPRSSVRVVVGMASRRKQVEVNGVSAEAALERLARRRTS